MTIEANSARANSSLPDVAEGTLRLQALAALFAGDYPRTAEAFLQAGAMPRGALGDYHRAAYALSLEGRWNEALAALNEGNRRALEEVRNPSPRTAPPGSDSFFGSSAYPPVRHLVGESLAAAGRLGLNALQDPRAARDAAAPVLALMAGDSASPGEESALRTLADVHEALGDNVAALRCLILARQSEVAERVEYARGGSKEDIGRLEDGEARPDSQRAPWAPDDPAIRLARAYAALVGHQPLPEVPVLGVVSADRPLVIDRWDEACWQFAWSKRGLNDFALVPPPGQAFAELSIVCEAPADGQVCPVSCWIGNRTDDWLESAQLAERTTGEWARGNSLVLDVPFDVPMVWLSLRGQADRAVVSARLRPSGQGRPAPPRVGGLAGFLQPLAGGSYTLDGEPLPTGMAFERVLPPGPHEFEFRGDDGQTRRRTLDIVSDATLPLFEHCENPFRPITLPLPAPRGRGNVGGSLARLPDGTRLLAYTTGERRQTRLVFACCPEKGRWSEPWAFAYDKVGPATRPTLLAHGGMVWMAYRAPLPAESWPHDGENLLWFCSTQDGKRWSRPQPVREASPSNGGWPGLTRLPDARLLLSGEDGFFSLADSPEQFHELDRLIAPLRGQHGDGIDSYEQRFAAVDSHGRMHVVVARAWKKGAESEDDEPEAYGLFYSYSDDLRHWAPLQLVQTTAPLFEPTSFALRGDRAAIVYDDDGRTWLWRGKLAENRLRMEPPVPIFNGFGAGPLICEGDKCSLVFTREGYVPCLLEANADDVFGTSSAGQP